MGHGVYASAGIMDTELVEPRGLGSFSYFQYRSDVEQYVDIVEGRMPRPAAAEGVIEVAIGRNAADVVGVSVGQTLRQPTSPQAPRPTYEALIVGVIEPRDADDEYWLAQGDAYFRAWELENRWVMPLFVPEETLVGRVGAVVGVAHQELVQRHDDGVDILVLGGAHGVVAVTDAATAIPLRRVQRVVGDGGVFHC